MPKFVRNVYKISNNAPKSKKPRSKTKTTKSTPTTAIGSYKLNISWGELNELSDEEFHAIIIAGRLFTK